MKHSVIMVSITFFSTLTKKQHQVVFGYRLLDAGLMPSIDVLTTSFYSCFINSVYLQTSGQKLFADIGTKSLEFLNIM